MIRWIGLASSGTLGKLPHGLVRKNLLLPAALILALGVGLWGCGAFLAEEDRSPLPPLPDRPILMVHGALGFGGMFDDFKSYGPATRSCSTTSKPAS